MSDLVHNERVKLFASFLNAVATASAAAGLFTTFSGAILRGEGVTLTRTGAVTVLFSLVFAFLLHGVAQQVLGKLRG